MRNKKTADRIPVHPLPPAEFSCALRSKDIENIFSDCADFEMRTVICGALELSVCWIDGIVSGTNVAEDVLRPLTDESRTGDVLSARRCISLLMHSAVYSYSVKRRGSVDELVKDLTHGSCAVIFDSLGEALTFEVRSDKTRSVSEPTLEKSLKGGKDSFVETLRVNTALVRRRVCSPKLKLIENAVGRKTHTNVAIMYIDGVVSPATVEELTSRLDGLDVDSLVAAGTLEEYIVDNPRSPWPQLLHTERPDRFAMYLLDGRVGLLVDGLPVALVLPASFDQFMRVTSDASMHFTVATSLTILRYAALILSLLLPAFYAAVSIYHQEMLPVSLLQSIISAKQGVPFSTATELISMMLAFSLLQEAGLRLPNPIGDTVSIIGALIVGQSAVEARVVSPIAIIVVALSSIACYTLPSHDMGSAVRIARFLLLLAAIVAGLYGVCVVLTLILLQLASMDNFGVNYTSPLSDDKPWSLLRLLLRPPKPLNKLRADNLNTPDKRRQI